MPNPFQQRVYYVSENTKLLLDFISQTKVWVISEETYSNLFTNSEIRALEQNPPEELRTSSINKINEWYDRINRVIDIGIGDRFIQLLEIANIETTHFTVYYINNNLIPALQSEQLFLSLLRTSIQDGNRDVRARYNSFKEQNKQVLYLLRKFAVILDNLFVSILGADMLRDMYGRLGTAYDNIMQMPQTLRDDILRDLNRIAPALNTLASNINDYNIPQLNGVLDNINSALEAVTRLETASRNNMQSINSRLNTLQTNATQISEIKTNISNINIALMSIIDTLHRLRLEMPAPTATPTQESSPEQNDQTNNQAQEGGFSPLIVLFLVLFALLLIFGPAYLITTRKHNKSTSHEF